MLKPMRRNLLKACSTRRHECKPMSARTSFQPKAQRLKSEAGISLIELLFVFVIIGIGTAIALPQMLGTRRLQSMASLPRQITSQLRMARQLAMSQRRAVTFQYDDQNKQISVIAHPTFGVGVLTDASYPNNTGSTQIVSMPMTAMGIDSGEVTYGIPSGAPTGALGDGTTISTLSTNRQINITFQPDGSVIAANGQPTSFALFFYNNKSSSKDTASAISVLGSAGRVKVWRYSSSASKFVE